MVRVMMIDDEPKGMDVMDHDIRRLELDVEVIGKYQDPQKGLAAIQRQQPDLLLLDIEMPWMNGFELLDQLDEINFEVIFVTAYDQFAIKAFRYYAVDYLLKPVDQESLRDALLRVIERKQHISREQLQALIDKLDSGEAPFTKLVLPSMEGYEFVEIDDVIRCEAANNYTYVFMSGGRKMLVSKHLKYLEELLADHRFYRVHQSHLIHLSHIARYVKADGGYLIMSDGSTVSISRSRKEGFVRLLQS
ncbi:MAG: LytTR family DNA-binding domain-containing protein [Saprospiraceae bacterium]|nr:LytTR family DNA-binding domain-containing protein [Saprospiraceae bacterium]